MNISIAMATYNGSAYIRDQLESIANQTFIPNELIITDDGSTDNTLDVVAEFSKSAPFQVRFYKNKKRLGYAGNFNLAISKTKGDLVFLCDQDDVWFKDKISVVVDLAKRYKDKLLFMNDAALTDANLKPVGLTKLGQIRSAGLNDSTFVMGCCVAVRRELLNICMPIPTEFEAHDNWIVQFADGLKCKMIIYQVLQYYRRHGGNESSFIANSTIKINRFSFYQQRVASTFTSHKVELSKQKLEQLEIFVYGLERAIERNEGFYLENLKDLLKTYRNKVESHRERISIRDRSLLFRVPAVIKYWIRGGYEEYSGIKSVMRDILG